MKGQRFIQRKGCFSRILIAGILVAAVLSIYAHETGFRYDHPANCAKLRCAAKAAHGDLSDDGIRSGKIRFVESLAKSHPKTPGTGIPEKGVIRTAGKDGFAAFGAGTNWRPGQALEPAYPLLQNRHPRSELPLLSFWSRRSGRVAAKIGSCPFTFESFVEFRTGGVA